MWGLTGITAYVLENSQWNHVQIRILEMSLLFSEKPPQNSTEPCVGYESRNKSNSMGSESGACIEMNLKAFRENVPSGASVSVGRSE